LGDGAALVIRASRPGQSYNQMRQCVTFPTLFKECIAMRKTGILTLVFAGLIGYGSMSLVPVQAQKDKDKGAVFEVYKDKSDEYRFRLVDGETKLAIAPHGYKTKEDVMKAIDMIKKDAPKAKVEEAKK
jgi:uncharacterized protein YegP (UPF0339 family)